MIRWLGETAVALKQNTFKDQWQLLKFYGRIISTVEANFFYCICFTSLRFPIYGNLWFSMSKAIGLWQQTRRDRGMRVCPAQICLLALNARVNWVDTHKESLFFDECIVTLSHRDNRRVSEREREESIKWLPIKSVTRTRWASCF